MVEDEYTRFKVLMGLAEKVATKNEKTKSGSPQAMVIIRLPNGRWFVTFREKSDEFPLDQSGDETLEAALETFIVQSR